MIAPMAFPYSVRTSWGARGAQALLELTHEVNYAYETESQTCTDSPYVQETN